MADQQDFDTAVQVHASMVRRADYVALLVSIALTSAGLFGVIPLWVGLASFGVELLFPLAARKVIELSLSGEKAWHRFVAGASEIAMPLARLGLVGYGIGVTL